MCLCCTTLRGVTYFMVNVHLLGSLALLALSAHTFLFVPFQIPAGLEDVNPLFIKNFPLLIGGYALAAAFFSCFLYRAVDMESLFQLTWSCVSFGGFQFLVIFLHLVFTVMFRDLVATQWQIVMVAVLIANFCATVVYLTVLFLYGKKIHAYKYNQSIKNSIGNNVQSSQKKQTNIGDIPVPNAAVVTTRSTSPNPADINLLENHPPVSRTNSVRKTTSTQVVDGLDEMESQQQSTSTTVPPPLAIDVGDDDDDDDNDEGEYEHDDSSPPPSYHSTPTTRDPPVETV